MKKILAFAAAAALIICCLSGCGGLEQSGSTDATKGGSSGDTSTVPPASVDFSQTDADLFTDRDLAGTYDSAVTVTLSGTGATCSGSGVSVSGSTVTVTAEGVYRFTGSLTDGMIVVDADGAKVQLVLDGVDIYSESGAPICVLNAKKVFLTLAEGSENTLSNGEALGNVGEYTVNAAVYSRSDLTVNGSGALTVSAPGGHGISCKDDLVITGGVITVTSANQGIDANDSIRICGGTVTVDAGKDGIHAENTDDATLGFVYISGGVFNIEAEGDGISAGAYLQIESGDFTILAGGGYENGSSNSSDGWGNMGGMMRPGQSSSSSSSSTDSESMKGLKAGSGMLITNGTFNIDSADDALHSDTSITVNGGTFEITSGDDGVHAETDLTITACTMNVNEAYEGLEAENIYVKGGTFLLNCSDDGLNASGGTDSSGTEGGRDGMFGGGMGGGFGSAVGLIEISGGTMTIYSCGDGLDSNGDLTISGGYIYVTNPKSGDVSVLDSQNAPVITGGTYIGLGISTMMAETFSSSSTQGVIACTVGNQAAGTRFTVADSSGNILIDVTAEYSTVLMIVSSPDIVKGETYTITAGTVSGKLQAS